jgi:CheY-like chemotaxis protein
MDPARDEARDLFNGKTLLVIDQDFFVSEQARRMVESWGGVFIVVDTVAQALELLRCTHVDAAIIDIDLETRDAFLLCERLDELDVPFVFAFGDSAAEAVRAHGGFALRGAVDALTDIGHGLFRRSAVASAH